MAGDSTWTDFETKDHTEEELNSYSRNVKDILAQDGETGFLLGKPTICDYTAFQICILDPQNDVPGNIALFANNVNDLLHGDSPSRIDKNDFSYEFNLGAYDFRVKIKDID